MTTTNPHDREALADVPVVDRVLRWFPVVAVVGGLSMLARKAARPLDDPDAWWHLRLGDDLWDQGSLTAPADWSPRATVDWVPSEPLPEILAARLHAWAGLPALAWLYGAAMAVVFLVVYWACRRHAAALTSAVVALIALVAMLGSLTPRPQLISFVLLAVVPIAWDRAASGLRPPWWLVPLTWLWSMCHGFWLLGVGLSGLCWLGIVLDQRLSPRDAVRFAGVPAASFVVVLLNPAGWTVILAPLSVNDTAQYIAEWQRTGPGDVRGLVCAGMIAAVAIVMGRRWRQSSWTDWLLLAAAVFFCWYSVRTIAVAAIVVAPMLARHLDVGGVEGRPTLPRRREVAALGMASVVVLTVLAAVVPRTSTDPGGVPTELSDELDRLPDGTSVLNAYGWGGWLSWRHPGLDRTSDGLVVPYDPDYIGRLSRIEQAQGDWQPLVAELGVDYALLPEDEDVTRFLKAEGWSLVSTEDDAVLLSRPGVSFPGGSGAP